MIPSLDPHTFFVSEGGGDGVAGREREREEREGRERRKREKEERDGRKTEEREGRERRKKKKVQRERRNREIICLFHLEIFSHFYVFYVYFALASLLLCFCASLFFLLGVIFWLVIILFFGYSA